jgi:hypothetical protein
MKARTRERLESSSAWASTVKDWGQAADAWTNFLKAAAYIITPIALSEPVTQLVQKLTRS